MTHIPTQFIKNRKEKANQSKGLRKSNTKNENTDSLQFAKYNQMFYIKNLKKKMT